MTGPCRGSRQRKTSARQSGIRPATTNLAARFQIFGSSVEEEGRKKKGTHPAQYDTKQTCCEQPSQGQQLTEEVRLII
jgi:hypothetical protein